MAECLTCQGTRLPPTPPHRAVQERRRRQDLPLHRESAGGDKRLVALLRAYEHRGDNRSRRLRHHQASSVNRPREVPFNYTVADSRWEHRVDMDLEEMEPSSSAMSRTKDWASPSRTHSMDNLGATTPTSSWTLTTAMVRTTHFTWWWRFQVSVIGRSRSRSTRLVPSGFPPSTMPDDSGAGSSSRLPIPSKLLT